VRRQGRRTRLERSLIGGDDEPRGLRIDHGVLAEQYVPDDLPGIRRCVMRADSAGWVARLELKAANTRAGQHP